MRCTTRTGGHKARPYAVPECGPINCCAEDLAEIALPVTDFAAQFEIEPRVAMLSCSNFGSTHHPQSDKLRRAVELLRQRRRELAVDGEMQADTAVVGELIDARYPFSRVKDANVLIFPSLEAANVAYKLLDRLGGARSIGPILLGTGAPIHVLQTGDDVEDIVHMAAVAAGSGRWPMGSEARIRYSGSVIRK